MKHARTNPHAGLRDAAISADHARVRADRERTQLVQTMREARSRGIAWTRIARVVLLARVGRATAAETHQEAERLRKLVERTSCPGSLRGAPRRERGETKACALEENADMPNEPTPRLRRRTIVEEYDDDEINADGLDGLDDDDDDAPDQDDEDAVGPPHGK